MGHSWKDVPGSLYVEILTAEWPKNITEEIAKVAKKNEIDEIEGMEIEIVFLSSGYHDEGKYYGPWEDSYPEEYEDERTLEYADLLADEQTRIVLNKELAEQIFEYKYEEVKEVEISD